MKQIIVCQNFQYTVSSFTTLQVPVVLLNLFSSLSMSDLSECEDVGQNRRLPREKK